MRLRATNPMKRKKHEEVEEARPTKGKVLAKPAKPKVGFQGKCVLNPEGEPLSNLPKTTFTKFNA